ncbi:ubiquitin-conjugating enzyme/RWD-like protein [Artemisia annua]|uniref:Ubiquitin-conjugating enzyme/RWD-like protein n=1 Tax=Artemisia annua TaxID=35608 RepID=A0A2U1NQP6_ARTAN|nr:ubiquitin-conjugating enzyme/RWD-like protein [Artemisia annua]
MSLVKNTENRDVKKSELIPNDTDHLLAILEKTWVPGTSNVLKYLVSIQGLNTKTLFSVLSMMGDTVAGGLPSLLYNENILIKSLKAMVCTMTKPPKLLNL